MTPPCPDEAIKKPKFVLIAGLLEHLEEREAKEGIKPDPQLANLMSGLHNTDDPSCNVALTLQLLSLVMALPVAVSCSGKTMILPVV